MDTITSITIITLLLILIGLFTFSIAYFYKRISQIEAEYIAHRQSNRRLSRLCSGGEKLHYGRFQMRVTAYCPCSVCCGQYADGITASGELVTANGGHFVAAPAFFPFRTLMVIPGYANNQPVPVLDRGGAIQGNRLDVFFADDPELGKTGHELAIEWGIRMLEVTIVEIPDE